MTLPQAFELALQRHQAGRLADAEALYRRILAVQPNHAEALRLLGVIAQQVGRHDLAVGWIRQAIALNPNNPDAHSNLGEACHSLGRMDEAIATFRRAVELKPDFPEFHYNLSVALRVRGQFDAAVAACRRALELKPNFPEAHNSLGAALAAQGRFDEAIAAYRRALELKPEFPEAHNNLGAALTERGQFDAAVAACRRALDLKPNFPEAYNNLGNALRGRGQFDEAVAACRNALQLKQDFPEAHNSLGAALAAQGQFDEAIAAYRRALKLHPDFAEAHNNLGNALRGRGQFDEAVAACRRALELKPEFAKAHNSLGAALAAQGQFDEAAAACRRALELKPKFAEAHNSLGAALAAQGQFDEAIAAYRRALELKPEFPEAHNTLGGALKDRGELDEAIAALRNALQLNPGCPWVHSGLISTLYYHPRHDARTIAEEHVRWNRRFSDPLKPLLQPHANDRNPGRRLRVGYVSSDFRDHPVGRFILPLFERHDHERFEILCYSGTARPDAVADRLRALASHWRNTVGVSDARLAEMIRGDQVDILVDLSLHTAGNRLPVFAWQPAPVQVAWLGSPGSTGLRGIDYRLTDARTDPPGAESPWSSEEPVRLPDCWCCYQPPAECPEINALPVLSAHVVTFGSLNNFAKVHEGVLALWARVLEAVKGSRLVMRCPEGQARERARTIFGAHGIAAERVELVGILSRQDYLGLYQRIDLGLDPFPYNGTATTCDALWMGVPVLTLTGEMPVSRAGLSLLSSVGLGELAASSEEDYVRMALELAGNLPRLADLRATLRPRMLSSPLMDAPRFARNVEAAYRSMWQTWCNKLSAAPE
jgi:protein O-GlcNAc transferase